MPFFARARKTPTSKASKLPNSLASCNGQIGINKIDKIMFIEAFE
jgi:hypothetical protein